MEIIAILAAVLLAAFAAFQVALAIGAPFGEYAWGGQNPGVLPARFRRSSAAAVPVYIGFIFVVLIEGGVLFEDAASTPTNTLIWIVTGLLAIGTVMNAASRSRKERFTWTPITAVVGVLVGLVAAGV